jgi:hypothetical protein
MSFQISGNSGTVAEVESASRAFRMTPRPTDVGALGSYSALSSSGTFTAGLTAASLVYAFRWTDASNLSLVRAVKVGIANTTGFTAGLGLLEMIAARSYTVADGTGSTQLVYTAAKSNARKTAFSTPTADIRISTTAAISGGTRTLDTQPLFAYRFPVAVTANSNIIAPYTQIWNPDFDGEWPLVLAQNEGFLLRATVPATGVWTLDVNVEWTEIASF